MHKVTVENYEFGIPSLAKYGAYEDIGRLLIQS
ncbi:hypothetical protein HS7_10490 [Sulfolobales archaeon HS-7]|nr:hypothetical protein HS7_10490 [Sulfolobales archaeon HS-7]